MLGLLNPWKWGAVFTLILTVLCLFWCFKQSMTINKLNISLLTCQKEAADRDRATVEASLAQANKVRKLEHQLSIDNEHIKDKGLARMKDDAGKDCQSHLLYMRNQAKNLKHG